MDVEWHFALRQWLAVWRERLHGRSRAFEKLLDTRRGEECDQFRGCCVQIAIVMTHSPRDKYRTPGSRHDRRPSNLEFDLPFKGTVTSSASSCMCDARHDPRSVRRLFRKRCTCDPYVRHPIEWSSRPP